MTCLNLGREQKFELWEWRTHSWTTLAAHRVLPTQDDTLIMIRKPGTGFCKYFEGYAQARGDASKELTIFGLLTSMTNQDRIISFPGNTGDDEEDDEEVA